MIAGAIAALAAAATLAAATSCAPRRAAESFVIREVTPVFLARIAAEDAALASDGRGRVALTYVTREGPRADLWVALSSDSGVTFDAPQRVNLRAGRVESTPEGRPVAAFGRRGELAIAWSERREAAGAVDLMVRASGDGGATLGMPVAVVGDPAALAPRVPRGRRVRNARLEPPSRHGHPSLAFFPDGALLAAWIAGHQAPSGAPAAAPLAIAVSLDGGQSFGPPRVLADSACACCRPQAAAEPGGRLAVSYRSAGSGLRDPALAVSHDRGATFPFDTVVAADRWRPEACPADPPSMAWNHGAGGTLAWFTGVEPAGVSVLPWHAAHGAAGVRRPIGDGLAAARRPRLAGHGPVTWLAVEARPAADPGRAALAVRLLLPDGAPSPWALLGAQASAGWIAALDARTAIACWSERDERRTRVRVARVRRRA